MSRKADDYHAALGALESAELSYRGTLGELALARSEHAGSKVTACRLDAERRETALKNALQLATRLHREYWQGRLQEMLPDVRAAAEVFGRYNRIASATGILGHNPAAVFCVDVAACRFDDEIIQDVPIEGPDSELLGEAMGIWRK